MVLLPALKVACSSTMVFFFRLRLQSVLHDLQYGFASVADEAERSVVQALL